MKTSKNLLPPGSVTTGASPLSQRSGTPALDAARLGHLRAVEALRRKAYLRLARTIGVSWLNVRRSAVKH